MRWIERVWYGGAAGGWLLRPLAVLYGLAIRLRVLAYRLGLLRVERLPVPVLVVGNVTVGGAGKTPLVVAVAERLRAAGRRPGIVSRGYGGRYDGRVRRVGPDDDPDFVGDEPVLLARRTRCPVAVAHRRAEAGRLLIDEAGVDVLIADDGLQHLRLARDVEIAVIDGTRRLGNGRLLPAGPLREPLGRLQRVDLVVANGGTPAQGEVSMCLAGDRAVRIHDGAVRPLAEFDTVHAVAGIGHPQRFFDHLRAHGLSVRPHPRPDHHRFGPDDLSFGDDLPVLMTEKDAVKCAAPAAAPLWFVPVEARFEAEGERTLAALLDRLAP